MSKKAARRKPGANVMKGVKGGKGGILKLDHDDPIVADNMDLKVDFTREPQDINHGMTWVRSYTEFLELEPKFNGVKQTKQSVKGVSSLTFTYAKDGVGTKDEALIYTSTGRGAIVVEVDVDKFKHLAPKAKRFLVPASKAGLRLMTVQGEDPSGAAFTFNLFSGKKPLYKDVTFRIVAKPE